MKRIYFFIASMLISIVSLAQWTKPELTPMPFATDTEYYLFNTEAEGFFVGANDWGTRASVDPIKGHKVRIEEFVPAEGQEINESDLPAYYLVNYVLDGGMKDQWGYMFLDDYNNIYVDNTKDGKKNNMYTFPAQGNNVYRIALSPLNETHQDTEAFLGVILEKQDTRLYFCDPTAYPNQDGCQVDWIFVTEADYQSYIAKREIYDAAMALKGFIDEAKATQGTDPTVIAQAEAVFNNTSSTLQEIQDITLTLKIAIKNAYFNLGSVDNPVEVLKLFNITNTFNNGADGWTSTTGAQNKGADNGNNAKDFAVTGNHYENWNGAAFNPGKISATAGPTIPAGVYHLNALAFTNTGKDAYLYAGDMRTPVTATQIDIEQAFDVYTYVSGETLEIGLDIPVKGPNWVGLDNAYLYYMGNTAESVEFLLNAITENLPDYEGVKAQASIVEAYNAAVEALKDATTDNIAELFSAFTAASKAMQESINAYAPYVAETDIASELIQNNTKETEDIELLTAYLYDIEEPIDGKYNGNGSGAYIMETCLLDATQIAAETEYLRKLVYNAQANSMADGDDCTKMLVNPNFNETGGWTAAQGINWPMGTDAFHVFEAWGRVCDVYQQLEGLQNGLYEMNLQAVYKTDGDESIRQTYAYINDFDTKIGVPDYNEPINSSEEASNAFAQGKYPVKVYGLVTDGKMKLGIANRLRTGENGALWAGGVTLTFRAKNMEALEYMLEALTPEATDLIEADCGQPESEALENAIIAAEDAATASEKYDALIALKNAIDAVKEGVELYKRLEVAILDLDEAIEKNGSKADKVTLDAAKAYLDEVSIAFSEKTLNNEQAAAAIEQLNTYKVAILMGQSIASEDNPVDYTSAIVNNNFDPSKGNKDEKRIDGWVVSGALNGYKQYTCSFNKGTFDLHQDLVGLPEGKYKVTVHTYYRAGSYEEEEANILAGNDTHLMKLYAGEEETSVMNLSEGAKDQTLPDGIGTRIINGITVPDGTGASAACFAAGLYLNELVFTVGEDGKATIGLKLDKTIGSNDYTVVGEWNLWYMGKPAPEVTEQDVTSLIVNPDFDPSMGNKDEKRIDGWVVSGALNGYKQNSCSFNKGTFDLHQDLVGLPKGNYKVTVHTYYRAGSYEEEEANILAGNDTHLMKLYAGDEETSVMNLSEGAKGQTLPEGIGTRVINGITVPDGTGASVACFAAGLYLNELEFTVGDDGKATIGLKLDKTIGSNDYTVVGSWKLYYYGASQGIGEESDQSGLIVNNNFDPSKGNKDEKRIDGWNVEGALNGYKQYSCSFNKGPFNLSQKISGLPEGTWKVTVHTFYRAGSYEEEEANILAGNDTHLCKMYAIAEQTYEKPVVNLSEGAMGQTLPEGIGTRVINGITVPDGTGASVACFAEGLYLNELPFYVGNGGEATIGLKLEKTIGSNDYVVCGEWNLYYYGKGNNIDDVPTSIEDIDVERTAVEAVPVAFYNMNGVRIGQPQRGINLIKMSDGRVVKVLVK